MNSVIALLCTVRGCARPLELSGRTLRCSNNHAFDLARSGYVNLLQPQDRRSSRPGDRREAVQARRSLFERGCADALFDALRSLAASFDPGLRVLDVGCGEGSHLGRLASRLEIDGSGIDISADAVDLAARRYPGTTWVVANADRWLPYADKSFDLITSITARRNPPEFVRVLRDGGRLFIAVPAPDDLAELREAAQGMNAERARAETVIGEFSGLFEVVSHEVIREQRELEHDALVELLHATYRGLRHGDRQRVEALNRMNVTFAWEVVIFRRKT